MPLVLIPEVEATHSSKASVNCYQTTPHHIPDLTFRTRDPKILGFSDGEWDCVFWCIMVFNPVESTYSEVGGIPFLQNLANFYHSVSQLTIFNPLNPELNPICYLLALLGAHHFLHVSRIRVKLLTLRRIMSYIYGAPILDVSRSHTMTQHGR